MSDDTLDQQPVPYEQYQHQLEAVAEASAAARRAEQQRDFLGDQLRRRVERFHGLRVAHGDIDATTMSQIVQQEIGALKAATDQIGAEG